MNGRPEAYEELARRLAQRGFSEAEVNALLEKAERLDAETKHAAALDYFQSGSDDLDAIVRTLLKDGDSSTESNLK